MSDERKYSIVGRVEIGTDEYRDLIEDKNNAEKEASDYRTRFWSEQNKSRELEDKVTALTTKVSDYEKFIKEENLSDKYRLWKFREDEDV